VSVFKTEQAENPRFARCVSAFFKEANPSNRTLKISSNQSQTEPFKISCNQNKNLHYPKDKNLQNN